MKTKAAALILSLLAAASAAGAANAQLRLGGRATDWKTLDVGIINDKGVSFDSLMPEDKFHYEAGAAFTPAGSIDCTDFSPAAAEYVEAIKRGAKVVRITIKGQKTPFFGVLALCKIYKTATGPAARTYEVQVPPDYLEKARDGFISLVAEKVAVARFASDTPTRSEMTLSDLFKRPAGRPIQPGLQVREDFSWILWLTDRQPTFQEAAMANAPKAAAVAATPEAAPAAAANAAEGPAKASPVTRKAAGGGK